MARVALVTGCSTGLGRALALDLHTRLDASGQPAYRVFATARKPEALADLAAHGIETLRLDVTNGASVKEAVDAVLRAAGRIDLVIQNAGLNRVGPLVEQPISEVQEVFETNVMGVLRMTQAVAPSMIARRSGLIVMIGSVSSQLATPFGGAYNASKAALLTLSDTLRLELAPFGVGVTYVMAGSIKSSFSDNIASALKEEQYEAEGSAYRPYIAGIRRRARMSQDPRAVMSADAVAAQVDAVVDRYFQAGGRRAAPIWFTAGGKALYFWLLGQVQRLVGWPVDGMVSGMFGLDKPPQ